MQMQLASIPAFPESLLAAMPQLSEKPRLGFATKKTTWNPGPNVCNFTVTLGLQAVVVENGVRKTYRARYYNPTTGRFLSEDPIGLAGGFNLYAYAQDSPTNRVDPSGCLDCGQALDNLRDAINNLVGRMNENAAHGGGCPGHAKAIQQAANRVQNAFSAALGCLTPEEVQEVQGLLGEAAAVAALALLIVLLMDGLPILALGALALAF
jgi:RHS repeat-associated protein